MGSETDHLERFVEAALQRGISREEIQTTLSKAGWPNEQIKSAIGLFADIPFELPVPSPRASLSSRDAFLYLVNFTALYYGAWHLGYLLFSFVDELIPDLSSRAWQSPDWDSQRWSVASIIIAIPLFIVLTRHINLQLLKNPIKRLSPIRRWLTYHTLFIAATSLIGDTTALLYNLLGGDTSLRFLLKVAIVALIAGTTFVYYLFDLKKDERE